MPALELALLLALPALALGAGEERAAESPYECAKGEDAVRDPRTQEWRCKRRLQLKRDVFLAAKHPEDPCPEGNWWHRDRKEACAPVLCKPEPQPRPLTGLCPPGQHEHLNSGADWRRPITCVHDYSAANEKKGGKPARRGSCELCVVKERGHYGDMARPWLLDNRVGEKAAGGSAGGAPPAARPSAGRKAAGMPRLSGPRVGGPKPAKGQPKGRCPAGTASDADAPDGCRPCPDGAVTARTSGGRNVCVGGEARGDCPEGFSAVAGKPGTKPLCRPCSGGTEPWVLDGEARCLKAACAEGTVPVPEGEATACRAPLEDPDGIDWSRVCLKAR